MKVYGTILVWVIWYVVNQFIQILLCMLLNIINKLINSNKTQISERGVVSGEVAGVPKQWQHMGAQEESVQQSQTSEEVP